MAVLREYLEATLDLRIPDADFITFFTSILVSKGTWTPADASGAGLSITVTDARYWKLGNLVIASAHIVYPVTANGSTNLVSGLPFPTNANLSSRQGNVSYENNGVPLYVLPDQSASTLHFIIGSVGVNATNAELSGTTIVFQLIYQTP